MPRAKRAEATPATDIPIICPVVSLLWMLAGGVVARVLLVVCALGEAESTGVTVVVLVEGDKKVGDAERKVVENVAELAGSEELLEATVEVAMSGRPEAVTMLVTTTNIGGLLILAGSDAGVGDIERADDGKGIRELDITVAVMVACVSGIQFETPEQML